MTGPDRLVTHVRLTIYPDGGVARLRVHGEVVPDPRWLGGRLDLAALLAGGQVADCSNMFYSSPANVLSPGRARVMSDGWETARRRDDGNDWLVVRLAAPAVLHEAVIDTSRFVGNAPGRARLTDAETGAELLRGDPAGPGHRAPVPAGRRPAGRAGPAGHLPGRRHLPAAAARGDPGRQPRPAGAAVAEPAAAGYG